MANPTTSIRLPEPVAEYLEHLSRLTADGRQPGAMAPRAVQLLMLLQRAELARFPLTLGEATLLADVMNGSVLDKAAGSILAMELADATQPIGGGSIGGDLTRSYELHHELPSGAVRALIERLQNVGPACDWALRFAIASWWDSGSDDHSHQLGASPEGFGAVGLRIVAPLSTAEAER